MCLENKNESMIDYLENNLARSKNAELSCCRHTQLGVLNGVFMDLRGHLSLIVVGVGLARFILEFVRGTAGRSALSPASVCHGS